MWIAVATSAAAPVASPIKARSCRIEKGGRDQLDRDAAARRQHMKGATEAGAATLDHGKGDGVAEHGAVVGGGDMTEARARRSAPGIAHELRAFLEHALAIEADQAHELLAV